MDFNVKYDAHNAPDVFDNREKKINRQIEIENQILRKNKTFQ